MVNSFSPGTFSRTCRAPVATTTDLASNSAPPFVLTAKLSPLWATLTTSSMCRANSRYSNSLRNLSTTSRPLIT